MLARMIGSAPETWLVAVSGGTDSMALLHALALAAPKHPLTLIAHGVDHGLRSEAAHELDVAERFANTLSIPFARTRLKIAPGSNLQARARTARYAALRTAAKGVRATRIATAHHMTDRAETVLMRILRGAGARGLGVLRETEGDLVRPIIHAAKTDVLLHLKRHDVPHSLDPSNRLRTFTRARIREEILPLLRDIDPQVESHLAAIAEELASETWGPALPFGRAQIDQLTRLAERRSAVGRVSLPGGLVAVYDRGQVEKSEKSRKRKAFRKG